MIDKLPGLALVGLLLACGCAEKGPRRYDVSGTVTFQGKPVKAGQVVFYPDRSKGNDGPQGIAEIHDGYFDTRQTLGGKGGPGGPVVVSIEGFDGKPTADQPYGGALFPPYRVEVDLPRENTTKDFDIPASAASPARSRR